MPRKKLPSATRTRPIQEHLTVAATAFAEEILRILSGSTLAELTTLTGHEPEDIAPVAVPQARKAPSKAAKPAKAEKPAASKSPVKAAPVAEEKKRPSPRTSALRRMAGTKPVECPVEGCAKPGIRSKMNFCNDHAADLPRAEKVKLRQTQRTRHLAAIKAGLVEPLTDQLPKKGKKKSAA